jgi:hypothetical protein
MPFAGSSTPEPRYRFIPSQRPVAPYSARPQDGTPRRRVAVESLHVGHPGHTFDLERDLERFQAKWRPIRVKKTRQIKNLEPRFDSIETEKALGTAKG